MTGTAEQEPWAQVLCSPGFPTWLAENQVSLGLTTYQTGKLFLLGLNPEGRLAVHERTFNRCMGLWGNGQSLWMSSLYQLWRFENVLQSGGQYQGHDRLYVPKVGFTTGDIDVHDVASTDNGVAFACTRFNCLATLHEVDSFLPLWKPYFISEIAPEDRCHLNGMAVDQGKPCFVTVVSSSNVAEGWREQRRDGGMLIDVGRNEAVVEGLSMPHSPRVYQNQIWLLNSGEGYFGRVDRAKGTFERLTFCPGYLRGLCFVGDYAVVGLSRPRHDRTFGGLRLEEELSNRKAEAVCGLLVIDLHRGEAVHWLRFEGMVTELYDVIALPGVIRPMALGFKSDEIQRLITLGSSEGANG